MGAIQADYVSKPYRYARKINATMKTALILCRFKTL